MAIACVAVFVLAGAARTARADDTPPLDDDGVWPWPKRSYGLAFGGHGGRLAGQSLGAFGPMFEVALGDHRWQYFAAGSLMWASVGTSDGTVDQHVSGYEGRAELGVRWLAKSFVLEREGAIEMTLEAFTGLAELWWKPGGRITRPDLGAGFAWQVRFPRSHFLFKSSARVQLAPDGEAPMALCKGASPCPTTPTRWSSGIMAFMGFAW